MDDAQLTALYEQYGYLVQRRCLWLLRHREEAEDAMQEVFVRVKKYREPDAATSMRSWLYRIATNCCFDLMQRRGREQPTENLVLEQLDERSTGAPTDADRRALLGAVLRKLDEKTREIGVLHYLDAYTQEEVAAQTGYSRKTVGKKLQLFEEEFKKLWSQGTGRSATP